ncbi:FAD-dependent oxidoreductase [Ancylothrix sp. C2]|uniref:FAD-dependent oxidoreductase n=1 Tax=Ancylothrix sp. D3o TaxID=2953691 RepID=UPI0021BAC934|nr:FAD-dependent oxidoreductase [Ancylothrix sp. D3o]MCT7950012.1 FAD-dependent oxidoreductase [Ancylothrix sp. D3o]
MNQLTTDILVVGTGTGGTAAAIQAARRGANTILIGDTPWLGGMLTSAGVSAPDGNELAPLQTGLWGQFLNELQHNTQLDNAWVSFFTYNPPTGHQIFQNWLNQLPNLKWIAGQTPQEILKQNNRITGIRFEKLTIHAKIILDATELGDILALAEIPHRWGWELQSQFKEPSAPQTQNHWTQNYPVQAPTWVVILQDYGQDIAPEIPPPPTYNPSLFIAAWDNYGPEMFLNYGRLPGNRFMINWPIHGNDYGEGIDRLIQSTTARQEFLQECLWHSQSFAHFMQTQLGRRYGLAENIFPLKNSHSPFPISTGAFAIHPYYRESRRLKGLVTIREQDILPIPQGRVAALPVDTTGQITSIAIGNYPNDHHYPCGDWPVKPKSIRWGGRWTGTPFCIPYGSLIPSEIDGLLVCEKSISVSHIANGATRLQPVVLNIGQAAGMAAALCIEKNCQPRDLPVRVLQEALLEDPIAPAAIIPLYNLTPDHPDWLYWQRYYLDHPDAYPPTGNCPLSSSAKKAKAENCFCGIFSCQGEQHYTITFSEQTWTLVTLQPEVNEQLQNLATGQPVTVQGRLNYAGGWLLLQAIDF